MSQVKSPKGWTEEKLAVLREMAEAGTSAQRIAVRLKFSVSTVKQRAVELGLALKSTSKLRQSYGLKSTFVQNIREQG